MNGGAATYNERSWAIDLIGHLKHLATANNRSIKDASGEQTVKAEGGRKASNPTLPSRCNGATTARAWMMTTTSWL